MIEYGKSVMEWHFFCMFAHGRPDETCQQADGRSME